jgi:hypothetical protein
MRRPLTTVLLAFLLCSSFATPAGPIPAAPMPPHGMASRHSEMPPSLTTPPSADEIIKQACTEAAATHKKVMVLFHASWCTWCHKLDTLMASPECRPLFDQSYVVCHLTIAEAPDKKNLENPGAEELYAKYADQNSGIPFFLILTPDGAVIADSRIKPSGAKPGSSGDNIGYPGSKKEITYFMRVLHETTPLTADQLKIIREKLPKG